MEYGVWIRARHLAIRALIELPASFRFGFSPGHNGSHKNGNTTTLLKTHRNLINLVERIFAKFYKLISLRLKILSDKSSKITTPIKNYKTYT